MRVTTSSPSALIDHHEKGSPGGVCVRACSTSAP
jgi:hypothetical protein